MSQHEYEPQNYQREHLDREIDKPHYPYTWSRQTQAKGLPRDEPLVNYDVPPDQPATRNYQTKSAPRQTQVPNWARPQPHQGGSLTLFFALSLLVLFILALSFIGILGAVLGALLHVLGALLGAALILLAVFFFSVVLIIALIGRTIARVFRAPRVQTVRTNQYARRHSHHAVRRAAHEMRKAARQEWRPPWL
jgi:predicted lipid-binding transport protein (Tim44 family)